MSDKALIYVRSKTDRDTAAQATLLFRRAITTHEADDLLMVINQENAKHFFRYVEDAIGNHNLTDLYVFDITKLTRDYDLLEDILNWIRVNGIVLHDRNGIVSTEVLDYILSVYREVQKVIDNRDGN